MQKVSLIDIPVDLGAESLGVNMGPQALRFAGIIEKLEKAGLSMTDVGTIPCKTRDEVSMGNPRMKYLAEIVRINTETAKTVDAVIQKGEKVIAIGGDHSLCLGTVSGASKALKRNLGLIYIDAHGDFNTDQTTISGNVHGMPLSAVVGYGASELVNLYFTGTKVKKENMLLIGVTDVDKAEEALIKQEKINMHDMADILAKGLGPVFGEILALSKRVGNIWISLDLDAIDYLIAPGVGIPSKGGLTYREIVALTKYIGKKCHVVGIEIVEYNPTRDRDHITADLAIELAANLLGATYNWYTEYMDEQKGSS